MQLPPLKLQIKIPQPINSKKNRIYDIINKMANEASESADANLAKEILNTRIDRGTFVKAGVATLLGGLAAGKRALRASAQEANPTPALSPERLKENKTFRDFVGTYLNPDDEIVKLINSPDGLDENRSGLLRLQTVSETQTPISTDSSGPQYDKFVSFFFKKSGFTKEPQKEPWDIKLGLGFIGDQINDIELSVYPGKDSPLTTSPDPVTQKGRLEYSELMKLIGDTKNEAPNQLNSAFKFPPDNWIPTEAPTAGNTKLYVGNTILGQGETDLADKHIKYTKDASGVLNMSASAK